MKAIVVASKNGKTGIVPAMQALRRGGSALDAVEIGCRLVEGDLNDHGVGVGGLPNLLGELELDAGIMDGHTLLAGAVAGLKEYPHPISVARRVMTDLPHVLLAGEGAARFAEECGFGKAATLTDEAMRQWRERLEGKLPSDATTGDRRYYERMWELAGRAGFTAQGEPAVRDTVNFIARDREGNIAVAASTSGWDLRYPGRAADSCVVGAGLYADNRAGAACCTGRGETAMQAGAARAIVLYLEMGLSLEEALRRVMKDITRQDDPYFSMLDIVALDAKGRHAAATNRNESYVYMTEEMDDCVEAQRLQVGDARADAA